MAIGNANDHGINASHLVLLHINRQRDREISDK